MFFLQSLELFFPNMKLKRTYFSLHMVQGTSSDCNVIGILAYKKSEALQGMRSLKGSMLIDQGKPLECLVHMLLCNPN